MGRKSYSVDVLNEFVIDNLTPYAWAHHWWKTEPDKSGRFDFCMMLEPNDYHHSISVNQNHISHPSSNSLLSCDVLPDPKYFQTYGISISMWNGSACTKNGIPLNADKSQKFKYHTHLAKSVITALDMLVGIAEPKISSVQEVFGEVNLEGQRDAWKKVICYSSDIDKSNRDEWSFV